MGIFLSLSKSTTLFWLNASEWALLIFGTLLVGGLIIEYRAQHGSRWMKLGELLVILGVAGELLGDGGIFLFSSHLQAIADTEIAELTTKLGTARDLAEGAASASKVAKDNSDAAVKSSSDALVISKAARREADSLENDIVSAKTQAADAESHLADALQRAADAKQEAVEATRELVKLKTPRSLSDEQQKRIISKLKPFAGTPFDLWVSGDTDSTTLLRTIRALLNSAEWKLNSPDGAGLIFDNAGLTSTSGVQIHVPKEHAEWIPAILAFKNALSAEGIRTAASADTEDVNPTNNMKRDRTHVIIGSKPLE
jgi:hypothetical protein